MRTRPSKPILFMGLLALFSFLLSTSSLVYAGAKDIFVQYKCNKCHEWKAQGVTKLPAEPDAPAADPNFKPDVSKMSDKVTGNKKDYLTKWLNKEIQRDGKDHKKRFAGTPEELKTLVDALAAQ